MLFNLKLDEALQQDKHVIIIEPSKLGKRCINFLTLGKYLRRFSCTCGLVSLLIGYKIPKQYEVHFIFASLNLTCALFYIIACNSDLCIRYKIVDNLNKCPLKIPINEIRTNKPVILAKDQFYSFSNLFHNSLFSLSLTYFTYKLFKIFLNST